MLRLLVFAAGMLIASNVYAEPSFCSTGGGFGQTFGDNRVQAPGRPLNAIGNRLAFAPQDSYPPFTDFEAGFTPRSRRLHSVQGTVLTPSRETAREAFVALLESMSRDARFPAQDIEEPDESASGTVWRSARFYTGADARADVERPSGLRITLRLVERVSSASTVSMECTDAAAYRRAETEALADVTR